MAWARIAREVNCISVLLPDHFSSSDMAYKVDWTSKRNHLLSSPDFSTTFKKRIIMFFSPFSDNCFLLSVCVCMPASMHVCVCVCANVCMSLCVCGCVCVYMGRGGGSENSVSTLFHDPSAYPKNRSI